MPDNEQAINALGLLQQMGLLPSVGQTNDATQYTNSLVQSAPITNNAIESTNNLAPNLKQEDITKPLDESITKPSQVSDQATNIKQPQALSKEFRPGVISNDLGDVTGSTSEYNNANNVEFNSSRQAATDKFSAEQARSERLYNTNKEYVDNLAKADEQHALDRDMAHKAAAAETASWMQEMDHKAAQKPSPGNWWHDQSKFGKVMWLLSLAFQAKAESLGSKNVISGLISNEIDADIAIQKEAINKQYELGKTKGQQMLANQGQKMADMTDDYSHKVGRINALLAANTAKANSATSEDLKSSYAQIESDLAARKTAVASKRLDTTYAERLDQINQRHATSREAMRLNHESNEKRLDRGFQQGEHVLDRKMHYDLAEISASEKLAAAELKAKKKQEMFEFPAQSGVNIRIPGKDGAPDQVGNFSVPKEGIDKANEIIQANQARVVGTQKLIDAIKDGGLPYGLASDNTEARKAMAQLADPILKSIGARFNKDTYKSFSDYITGEDPSSFMQRAKGGSKEDIIKLLEKDIQELPGAARQSLLAIPGTNLADNPDADLVFTSPETRGPKQHEFSPDEKVEAATGNAPAPVTLKNAKDVKEYGADAERALPSDLQSTVEEIKTKLAGGFDKSKIDDIAKKGFDKVDEWNDKAQDSGSDPSTAYLNSRALINDAYERASKVADKLPKIKEELRDNQRKGMYGDPRYGDGITRKEVEERLNNSGIVIPVNEIKAITEEIRKQPTHWHERENELRGIKPKSSEPRVNYDEIKGIKHVEYEKTRRHVNYKDIKKD